MKYLTMQGCEAILRGIAFWDIVREGDMFIARIEFIRSRDEFTHRLRIEEAREIYYKTRSGHFDLFKDYPEFLTGCMVFKKLFFSRHVQQQIIFEKLWKKSTL